MPANAFITNSQVHTLNKRLVEILEEKFRDAWNKHFPD